MIEILYIVLLAILTSLISIKVSKIKEEPIKVELTKFSNLEDALKAVKKKRRFTKRKIIFIVYGFGILALLIHIRTIDAKIPLPISIPLIGNSIGPVGIYILSSIIIAIIRIISIRLKFRWKTNKKVSANL